MIRLIMLVAFLMSVDAKAEVSLFKVYRLSMEYLHYVDRRDPYIPDYDKSSPGLFLNDGTESNERWTYGFALLNDIELVRFRSFRVLWKNRWYMDSTNKRVRNVGWTWTLNVPIGPKLELIYRHNSRHCLECNPGGMYPLENAYVIRYNLIGE